MGNRRKSAAIRPKKLFVSYSHRDKRYAERFFEHLASLKREGVIQDWSDHEIAAGSQWDAEVQRQLDAAAVVVALISPSFISSDYAYEKELSRAMERYRRRCATVIPVIVRPCVWKSLPIGALQALPSTAKPISQWSDVDAAFADVVEGIRTRVTASVRRLRRKRSPSLKPEL